MSPFRFIIGLSALAVACEGAGYPITGSEPRSETMDNLGGQAGEGGAPASGGAAPSLGGTPMSVGGEGGSAPGPEAVSFSEPTLVSFSHPEFNDQDPFLTEDGLELFFSSNRDAPAARVNIWVVKRETPDADWGTPEPVASLNSDQNEATPALTSDGLSVFFGRSDGENFRLFTSERADRASAWSVPTVLGGVGNEVEGLSPTLSSDDLTLYYNRAGENLDVEVFSSQRADTSQSFSAGILFDALNSPGDDWDLSTSDDLTFYLARDQDLYEVSRPSLGAPFGEPLPVTTLNTSAPEFDPFISTDGQILFFASKRDDVTHIYEARRD